MQVVVLAGGRGTRMGELARGIPKPMIRLAGKPILEYQLELARRCGADEAILLTGYLGQVIEEHFRDEKAWGMRIRCHREDTPLGTAGALKEIEDWLDDDFLVFYGDTIMDLDLGRLWHFHQQHHPLATLVVHPNSHPQDSDLLELDAAGRVVAFHPKPRCPETCYRNLANAALYVLARPLLGQVQRGQSADLGRDVFPAVLASGGDLRGYNTCEYIVDAGTIDRLRRIEADVRSGRVSRLNRSHPRKAVFLDRDGVLNVERDHVTAAEQLHLLPGTGDAVRRINQSEYLAVVVTNQPAVAKGFLDEAELDRIHARLDTLLGAEHAYLDRIYYCPHHPEKGFAGERPQYKIACSCRKPAPGMILAAAAELNIELANSFVIGDRTADLAAGAAAGCRTVLVRTGFGGRDGKHPCTPDYVFDDLGEAVRHLIAPQSTGERP